mgnify:CR=1 FL=1
MLEVLKVICFVTALICFVLFFVPGRFQKYLGIAAWSALVAGFLCMLPELMFHEGNVFYPVLIILCLPLLYITIRRLLAENEPVKNFTRGAGVAAIIYAPFAIFEPLGNWLIGTVVYWVQQFFHLIDYPFKMAAWNMFESLWLIPGFDHGYRDVIVLGCTGITAIAILIGVIFLTKTDILEKEAGINPSGGSPDLCGEHFPECVCDYGILRTVVPVAGKYCNTPDHPGLCQLFLVA